MVCVLVACDCLQLYTPMCIYIRIGTRNTQGACVSCPATASKTVLEPSFSRLFFPSFLSFSLWLAWPIIRRILPKNRVILSQAPSVGEILTENRRGICSLTRRNEAGKTRHEGTGVPRIIESRPRRASRVASSRRWRYNQIYWEC